MFSKWPGIGVPDKYLADSFSMPASVRLSRALRVVSSLLPSARFCGSLVLYVSPLPSFPVPASVRLSRALRVASSLRVPHVLRARHCGGGRAAADRAGPASHPFAHSLPWPITCLFSMACTRRTMHGCHSRGELSLGADHPPGRYWPTRVASAPHLDHTELAQSLWPLLAN